MSDKDKENNYIRSERGKRGTESSGIRFSEEFQIGNEVFGV